MRCTMYTHSDKFDSCCTPVLEFASWKKDYPMTMTLNWHRRGCRCRIWIILAKLAHLTGRSPTSLRAYTAITRTTHRHTFA